MQARSRILAGQEVLFGEPLPQFPNENLFSCGPRAQAWVARWAAR